MSALAEAPALSAWDGHVVVAVERSVPSQPTFTSLHSSGALAVRTSGHEAWLVGAGAHPIGGDRLRVDVSVGPQAALRVRSTSATLARRSLPPRPSTMEVVADVAEDASLAWTPEPGLAATGSCHHSSNRIALCATSALMWSDVIVLGRMHEEPGSWTSRTRVDVAGRPLVVSELALGPASPSWSSPAAFGGARCAWNLLIVDPRRPAPQITLTHPSAGYLVPLDANALNCMAWGDTVTECGAVVRSLCTDVQVRDWIGCAMPPDLYAAWSK